MDKPAQWATERADKLYGDSLLGDSWRDLFARYIEAHEQPPVDPDREALIDVLLCLGIGPDEYTIPQFKAALAKLKEARGA